MQLNEKYEEPRNVKNNYTQVYKNGANYGLWVIEYLWQNEESDLKKKWHIH